MPISASSDKPPQRMPRNKAVLALTGRQELRRKPVRGFTLLEMLVVLVILGLTAGVVVPQMSTMGASFDFALKRESFEQALNGLAYQAFRDNQDLILLGDYTDAGRVDGSEPKRDPGNSIAPSMRTLPSPNEAREHLPPLNPAYAKLPLPSGWRATVADPVYFRASGFCGGGMVTLDIGRAEYSYALSPPQCHAHLVE